MFRCYISPINVMVHSLHCGSGLTCTFASSRSHVDVDELACTVVCVSVYLLLLGPAVLIDTSPWISLALLHLWFLGCLCL